MRCLYDFAIEKNLAVPGLNACPYTGSANCRTEIGVFPELQYGKKGLQ
jgi:hypothetical protein